MCLHGQSAETTLVIYGKHCKIGCIYRNVYEMQVIFNKKEKKLFSEDE
jgi:hypothetical protein